MRSTPARKVVFSGIGTKVLIGLLVAALLPLLASIILSLVQIGRMNSQSISTGSNALSSSAQQALQTQESNIALTTSQRMQLIGQTTEELASYAGYLIDNATLFSGGIYPQDQTMHKISDGFWGNSADPQADPASALISQTIPRLTPSLRRLLDIQTYLDPIFKAHYDEDQYPTYFGTTAQVIRYYPNVNLANIVPSTFDVTQRPWFVAADPQHDPQHLPVFSQLYDDAAQHGLVITSSAPVYDANGNFIGVVGRDVTLQTILDTILPPKIGQNGYTFLVDQSGSIVSMPGAGLVDFGINLKVKTPADLLTVALDDQKDPNIIQFTKNLANQQSGIARLPFKSVYKYLAYGPVTGTSWDVVLVQPESEVLAPIATLNAQLDQQISLTQRLSLGLTLGLIVLASIIAYLLSRNIAQPLLSITKAANYLVTGQSIYADPEDIARQERLAKRRDEVGDLARAFDAIDRYFEETSQLADQIAQGNLGIQVHRTSDQDRLGLALENMMSYLNQILQVATRLANGDLSQDIEPRSNSDVLGNSFKHMLDELRALVMRMQAAGREIEAASAFVLQRSAFLVDASERQMEQIIHVTTDASQMAQSNHRVAEDTYTLARVAYNARGHAQTGYQAVQETIAGMNQIQEDVRLAAQRVGQLTRRTQEITHVVEVITGIAHQTNRLALDAAIHASAAGPYGRNFNIVATNIRHLAEQVKEEANQISRTIQNMVEETNQAIQTTKQSQQRVVEGVNLATSAGTALEAISKVVDQQGQLVEVINQIAKQQRDTSVAVAQEMQAASDITTQYSAGTRQTAQSIERLAYLARQLKESVEAFTLPASYNRLEPPQQYNQIPGMQMRSPVRSARPTPLLPQGNSTNGWNGRTDK